MKKKIQARPANFIEVGLLSNIIYNSEPVGAYNV